MSLRGDKYETAEEIRFRLEQTVVTYDGEPVYITKCTVPEEIEEKGEIARVFFYDLPLKRNAKETRKYLSSKKFDLTPLKLGYFNFDNRAIFVSRAPVRQNKQGLCANTASFSSPKGARDEGVNFQGMIACQGFIDMVKGKYPDFKTAGEMLGDNAMSSVAVSRSFAFIIENDLEALILVHKGAKCGIAIRGEKLIKVPPKFHFLREEMEECRIPIG